MAQRDRSKIISSLKKKGFRENKGGNHDIFILFHENKKTQIFTLLSRGKSYKTYGQELLSRVGQQLKLKNNELLNLIDCPMKEIDYIQKLERDDII